MYSVAEKTKPQHEPPRERIAERRLVMLDNARRLRAPDWLPELVVHATMLAAAMVAMVLTAPEVDLQRPTIGWLVAFPVVAILALWAAGAYEPRLAPKDFFETLRTLVAATAVAAMVLTFFEALLGERETAQHAVRAWVLAIVYLAAGRAGYEIVRRRLRRRGRFDQPTLIAGAGKVGHKVAERLLERPQLGIRPVAFLDNAPLPLGGAPLPVIGFDEGRGVAPGSMADQLAKAVHEHDVRHLIMAFSLQSHEAELETLRACEHLGVSVSLVPRLYERFTDETTLERLGGLPLISSHPSNPKGVQYAFKYALGRLVAAMILLLASPVLLILGLGVMLTMGRPVFFRQERVGLDGRRFEIFKFRTMRTIAQERATELATAQAMVNGMAVGPGGVEGEDRRTRFGAFLRRTSLDELPQLLNVVRGEMSLVGPRPERSEFVREFDRSIHRYRDRRRVKSGITGWAQVHGLRGRTSLEDRVEWDNYYIENWSLWLDIKILFLSVLAVFAHDSE